MFWCDDSSPSYRQLDVCRLPGSGTRLLLLCSAEIHGLEVNTVASEWRRVEGGGWRVLCVIYWHICTISTIHETPRSWRIHHGVTELTHAHAFILHSRLCFYFLMLELEMFLHQVSDSVGVSR